MKCTLSASFATLFLASIVQPAIQGDAPVLSLAQGRVKGEKKESRDDKTFYAYRGIPYATAKRFEAPERPKNWSDIRDAREYGKTCIQYSTYEKKVIGSEDCLFINIFTPEIGGSLSKKLLPVMVFIHGTFMDGTSEIYRAHYFMDEEIVIVTFNYRMNIFGFLSTEDEVISGNMGLKDQVMALHWVQENIRKFAGDPNRVTIFGAGDGGSSVHLLMLSPMAKGLFRKAISQSGSALKLNVIQRNPKQAAQRIARLMSCDKVLNGTQNATIIPENGNCLFDNSSIILNCLKLVDAKKLAAVQKDAFSLIRDPLTFFGPVIEKPIKGAKEAAFLTEHPYSIISSGRQAQVPWMTGIDAHEGLIATGIILSDKDFVDKIDSNWEETVPRLLKYDPSRTDITLGIRKFYLNEENSQITSDPETASTSSVTTLYPTLPTVGPHNSSSHGPTTQPIFTILEFRTINFEEQFKSFTDMFTDRFYASAIYSAIQYQPKHSPVYMYMNNYEGQFTLLDVYTGKAKEPTPAMKKVTNWFKKNILGKKQEAPKHLGVCNGDELLLLFKYPNLKIKENTKDYQMSKELVKVWVQFAADETKMRFHNTTWLPVTLEGAALQVMKIGTTEQDSGFGVMSDGFMARMRFWSSLNYLAPFDQ